MILALMIVETMNGQDPQFSQFYAAPLYLGPSMAGSAGNSRLCLNFRDQWPKLTGKFITYALSFDTYLQRYNSGAGVFFMSDNAGSGKLTTVQAGLNYSYRIKVNSNIFIQPGLEVQYFERKVNFSKLTFADQFYGDLILPGTVEVPLDEQKGHMDFSTSVLTFTKNVWMGATIAHLMKTNETLEANVNYVPLKASVFGGVKLMLKRTLMIKDEQSFLLAFNYRNQANMQQLDLGAYYHRMPFMVGLWYRGIPVITSTKSKDAMSISAGVLIDHLSFTYSYDLTVSSLITSTGGAHELSLVYLFEQPKGRNKRKMGAVPCPKF
jgi:type IX secretion system PorP/SprF family membrane protein